MLVFSKHCLVLVHRVRSEVVSTWHTSSSYSFKAYTQKIKQFMIAKNSVSTQSYESQEPLDSYMLLTYYYWKIARLLEAVTHA